MKQNLPNANDAEKGFLCSIITDPKILDQLPPVFSPDWFSAPAHRLVFAELKRVWGAHHLVEFVEIKHGLAAAGNLEEVGGAEGLNELWSFVPSAANWPFYLNQIWECWVRRQGIIGANELAEELGDMGSEDPFGKILNFSNTLGLRRPDDAFRSFKEILLDVVDEISARADRKQMGAIRLGIRKLDEAIGGLEKGNLAIIGGETGFGKSALMFQAVREAAGRDIPSAIFPFEMSPEEVAERILVAEADISMRSFGSGLLSVTEYPKLPSSVSRISGYPIWIVADCAALTASGIVSMLRWLKSAKGIRLAGVDYIQIVPADTDHRETNREREVADISRKLKLAARELGLVILGCSQLNEQGRLRESRAIGQDADLVLKICEAKDSDIASRREIIITKHRNGPAGGRIPVDFYGQYMKFEDAN